MVEINQVTKKLIILYMLDNVSNVPSNTLLTWALESCFLDYFAFIQAKEALKKDNLIIESIRKDENRLDANGQAVTMVDITPEGEMVLKQLLSSLPQPVKLYLTQGAQKWQKDLHLESSISAYYTLEESGFFAVHLTLSDNNQKTVEIKILAPNEKSAQEMCKNWKENTSQIYLSLLTSLQ